MFGLAFLRSNGSASDNARTNRVTETSPTVLGIFRKDTQCRSPPLPTPSETGC